MVLTCFKPRTIEKNKFVHQPSYVYQNSGGGINEIDSMFPLK